MEANLETVHYRKIHTAVSWWNFTPVRIPEDFQVIYSAWFVLCLSCRPICVYSNLKWLGATWLYFTTLQKVSHLWCSFANYILCFLDVVCCVVKFSWFSNVNSKYDMEMRKKTKALENILMPKHRNVDKFLVYVNRSGFYKINTIDLWMLPIWEILRLRLLSWSVSSYFMETGSVYWYKWISSFLNKKTYKWGIYLHWYWPCYDKGFEKLFDKHWLSFLFPFCWFFAKVSSIGKDFWIINFSELIFLC